MNKTRVTVAAATAVMLLVGWCAALPAQAGPRHHGPPGTAVTVMSYNIRYDKKGDTHPWSERLPLMAERLQQLHPDVLGVQEALHNQMTDLAASLPGYAWVGQGREGGTAGEYMGLFYDAERLTLLEHGDFWLSDTPSVPGSTSWGNRIPRMVTWALLRHGDREPFYVFNTHFDCDSTCGNPDGNSTRTKMAQMIVERTQRLGHPVLVTGDFNAAAGDSDPYDVLTARGALADTWEESERRGPIVGTFNNYGPVQLGGTRIDWILRKGKVRTLSATIDTYGQESGTFASDHLPTIVDAIVGQKPTGPIADVTPPDRIATASATAAHDANAVALEWAAGSDNVGVESYNVYASTDPAFVPEESTELANVPVLSFVHRGLGLGETWYYRVAAVDRLGNIGEPSARISATTDPTSILLEAEDGVPLLDGSAEARSQSNCCQLDWSNDHQLLVLSSAVGDVASWNATVPAGGTFYVAVDATTAGDFATWTLAIDGEQVGTAFDAYSPAVALQKDIGFGSIELEEGVHRITVTVVGHNDGSTDYRMGIDAIRLTLE